MGPRRSSGIWAVTDGSRVGSRRWRRCIGSWCVAGSSTRSPANGPSRRGAGSRHRPRTSGGRSTPRSGRPVRAWPTCSTSSMTTRGWRAGLGRWSPTAARRPGPRSARPPSAGVCRPGCCRTTGCASPGSCAASRSSSKPSCVTPGCDRSPGGPITPRPPAKSNGSNRR